MVKVDSSSDVVPYKKKEMHVQITRLNEYTTCRHDLNIVSVNDKLARPV